MHPITYMLHFRKMLNTKQIELESENYHEPGAEGIDVA